MAILIDTSVFIAAERRGLPTEQAISFVGSEEVVISSITASELLFGVHRADTVARRAHREAFVEAILGAVLILPVDLHVARVHARLSAQLASLGQPVGAHDLLIGATAMAHNAAVLTANPRDFQRLPGLVIRQPVW